MFLIQMLLNVKIQSIIIHVKIVVYRNTGWGEWHWVASYVRDIYSPKLMIF